MSVRVLKGNDDTLKLGDLKRVLKSDYLRIISWVELNHEERTRDGAISWDREQQW